MRVVEDMKDLRKGIAEAQREAKASFGDGTVYVEKYLRNARHVEVQVLGDGEKVIHVGERDCSLQRRHQKLLEETPCPVIDQSVRKKIWEAAVELALSVKYIGAGTVEFLVDIRNSVFYFIEMNTRIQVEHPITEAVSGIDLVAEQLRIARDGYLRMAQSDVNLTGHSIECRITAEDPRSGFAPRPGRLSRHVPPGGPGVRVDTHCYQDYVIPHMYDSLLSKVITYGIDREHARRRMVGALREYWIDGIPTTLTFHRALIEEPAFVSGEYDTEWIEGQYLQDLAADRP